MTDLPLQQNESMSVAKVTQHSSLNEQHLEIK